MKQKYETWSDYLSNSNVRPKTFNVTLRRESNGQYVVVGNQTLMEDNDGFNRRWVRVNSRDFVQSVVENGLLAR